MGYSEFVASAIKLKKQANALQIKKIKINKQLKIIDEKIEKLRIKAYK